MTDVPDDNLESTPRTSRGQRVRSWVSGHPRLRFALFGLLALGLIAGTWAGLGLNANSAAAPGIASNSSTSNTESSESPSPEPSSTSPEDEKTEKKDEKKQPPNAEPEEEEETSKPQVSPGCEGYSGNQLTACQMLGDYDFGAGQMDCLSTLWDHESGWNHKASNPSSGAYGIPQALPGSKMASAGGDWQSNPATQIEWGLGYIADRYGDPCGAWSFWQANNYY